MKKPSYTVTIEYRSGDYAVLQEYSGIVARSSNHACALGCRQFKTDFVRREILSATAQKER